MVCNVLCAWWSFPDTPDRAIIMATHEQQPPVCDLACMFVNQTRPSQSLDVINVSGEKRFAYSKGPRYTNLLSVARGRGYESPKNRDNMLCLWIINGNVRKFSLSFWRDFFCSSFCRYYCPDMRERNPTRIYFLPLRVSATVCVCKKEEREELDIKIDVKQA